jgi:hypothetical protein
MPGPAVLQSESDAPSVESRGGGGGGGQGILFPLNSEEIRRDKR